MDKHSQPPESRKSSLPRKHHSLVGSLLAIITPAKTGVAREALSEGEIREWMIEKIAEVTGLPVEQVDPRTPFADFGLDSRTAVSMAGELERLLDRELSPTLIWDFPTIDEVAHQLYSASPETDSQK